MQRLPAEDLLFEDDRGAAHEFDAGADGEQVVQLGGTVKFERRIRHNDDGFARGLHPVLFVAQVPQHFAAGPLHVPEVIGVINNAARVGIFPIDPHGERKFSLGHEKNEGNTLCCRGKFRLNRSESETEGGQKRNNFL